MSGLCFNRTKWIALVALILINGYIIWAPLAALAVKLGLLKTPSEANI